MIPRDFHFSSFYLFWNILWLIPLFALVAYSLWKKKRKEDLLVQPSLQDYVFNKKSRFRKLCFFSLGWVFSIIALMNPLGNEYYPKEKQVKTSPSVDLFLLVDVSQSMAVADMRNKKTRLDFTEEIIDELIAQLKFDSVALFVFTTELVPLVPLTLDRSFLRLMLGEIQLNAENHFGTGFSPVFHQLNLRLKELYPQSRKAVVIFSDGEDTTILALPESEKKRAIDQLATEGVALQVPIYTVGVGSNAGGEVPDVLQGGKKVISKRNEALLATLGERTGGRYFSVTGETPKEIAERINQSLEKVRINVTSTQEASGFYHYYFQIPLLIALLCFFFSRFSFLVSLMVLIVSSGDAANLGESLFDAGKYQEAADWFSGELKHLPPEWLQDKLLYNTGTAFLKANQEEEAKRAYFAISKEAYSYPLFNLRLVYNQVLSLLHAQKLQSALFLLQLIDLDKCHEDCPELLLKDLKRIVQKQLSETKINPQTDSNSLLDQLIQQLRFASFFQNPPLAGLESILDELKSDLPNAKELPIVKEHLKRGELSQAALILVELKERLGTEPRDFLKAAIEEISLARALEDRKTLFKNGKQFYSFLLEWQKNQFSQGKCQCSPWDEALPLFTEGLRMLELDPFTEQFSYTYVKWQEVLSLLQSNKSAAPHQQQEDKSLQELREMQELDKQPKKAKMKSIGQGMPW